MTAATVLITLTGPLQAWGRFARLPALRDTAEHPTFGGVVGLVGNALGMDYTDPVDLLTGLRFAVRADRPGQVIDDFHTAGGGQFPALPGDLADGRPIPNPTPKTATAGKDPWAAAMTRFVYGVPLGLTAGPDGPTAQKNDANPIISTRRYLADAVFTAALTGEPALIDSIAAALTRPARPLFLGRRSCPPTGDLLAAHTADTDPRDALTAHPLHQAAAADPDGSVPCWDTAPPGDTRALQVDDVPAGRFGDRRYRTRWESRHRIRPPQQPAATQQPDFFTGAFTTEQEIR